MWIVILVFAAAPHGIPVVLDGAVVKYATLPECIAAAAVSTPKMLKWVGPKLQFTLECRPT